MYFQIEELCYELSWYLAMSQMKINGTTNLKAISNMRRKMIIFKYKRSNENTLNIKDKKKNELVVLTFRSISLGWFYPKKKKIIIGDGPPFTWIEKINR